MGPTFLMTDIAANNLIRLKSYEYMKNFFEFYSRDNSRGQFINWDKKKYAENIENMRKEMDMMQYHTEPRVQVALASKITSLIENGILSNDESEITKLIAFHNQQVAEQKKQSSHGGIKTKEEDPAAIDRRNLSRMLKGEGGIEVNTTLQYMEPALLPEYLKFLEGISEQFKKEADHYISIHEQNKIFFLTKANSGKSGKKAKSGESEDIGEYKDLLLPDLLKIPSDIKIIDDWLLEEQLIKVYEGSIKKGGPYQWIPSNKNKEEEIVSILNRTNDLKINSFSARRQIAALGYWLHAKGKIVFDKDRMKALNKYNASKLSEAVLRYYNVEITASTKKAFQEQGGKIPLHLYSSYFEGLGKKLRNTAL